jgi:hypothetical protein
VERIGLDESPPGLVKEGEVVEALADVGVLGVHGILSDSQRPLLKQLGPGVPALGAVETGQVVLRLVATSGWSVARAFSQIASVRLRSGPTSAYLSWVPVPALIGFNAQASPTCRGHPGHALLPSNRSLACLKGAKSSTMWSRILFENHTQAPSPGPVQLVKQQKTAELKVLDCRATVVGAFPEEPIPGLRRQVIKRSIILL